MLRKIKKIFLGGFIKFSERWQKMGKQKYPKKLEWKKLRTKAKKKQFMYLSLFIKKKNILGKHTRTHTHIYIYIYIERERERETCVCVCVCVWILNHLSPYFIVWMQKAIFKLRNKYLWFFFFWKNPVTCSGDKWLNIIPFYQQFLVWKAACWTGCRFCSIIIREYL